MEKILLLQEKLKAFAEEREWTAFHTPKNLAMALSIEASELMELFLWKTDQESFEIRKSKDCEVQEELADVFLYLLRLASILDIDLVKASLQKIKKNGEKYPVELCKGSYKKYTELHRKCDT